MDPTAEDEDFELRGAQKQHFFCKGQKLNSKHEM